MNREERNRLRDGNLTLVSAYDPNAGFNIGHAMQRNKLIYALADTSLVVNSDLNKGGTWAGAIEQLETLRFVPVFIRSTGEASEGLTGLQKKGALPWPNPQSVESFIDVFSIAMPMPAASPQLDLSLSSKEGTLLADVKTAEQVSCRTDSQTEIELSEPADILLEEQPTAEASEELSPLTKESLASTKDIKKFEHAEATPAEVLFTAVRAAIQQLLSTPMNDAEVAVALNVSNLQAKAWLQRLIDEGVLEKQSRPLRYVVKKKDN